MNKFFRVFLVLIISAQCLSGQLNPVTNQYILNPLTINPAFAGNRGTLNMAAFYRRQWMGIAGAPETMTLTMDAPLLDSKIGLGFIVTNDKIGVTKETRFNAEFAYKINMGKGNLSMGLGAGVITTNTAWSELSVEDPGDEYYLVNSRSFVVPDFSFGVYYSHQKYFAGISVPKLLGYKFDYNKNRYTLMVDPGQYHYLVNTGYVFRLSPVLILLPSALLTYASGERLLYDINLHFNISNFLWFGGSYRDNRSLAGLVQIEVNQHLKVAYTYDFDFGRLRQYSHGSHEVMLRYEFHNKVKVVNQLIF